jgi:beta-glucosidase/6-phospho-beta-glucosidase/beta-galactosidase
MLDCMEAHGLEPNATLWHFVHPTWFEDAGGFTREENIPAFVEYSKRCFKWFGSRIRLWATFNEPTVRRSALSRASRRRRAFKLCNPASASRFTHPGEHPLT